jgi:SAM-dependent methyltransferase
MHVQIILDAIQDGTLPTDEQLDALLPESYRVHADQHFSGVFVIEQAARFLADRKDPLILDVGSGSGKFCLLGALLNENAHFTGVEFRAELVSISRKLAEAFKLQNIDFVHDNILNSDFQKFNGFFIFNPFLEHRKPGQRMQGFSDHDKTASIYEEYLSKELSLLSKNTKMVTYYMDRSLIPNNFHCVREAIGGTLLFWESIG